MRVHQKKKLNGKRKTICVNGTTSKIYHEPLTCGMSKYSCVAKSGKVMHKKKNQRANQEGENQELSAKATSEDNWD